jgi:hypothetical protein
MIPAFTDSGALPPGIHPATLAEIDARFGRQSEIRRVQMESIRWMIDLAARVGVQRVVLNGSFVTDIMEPNDVDCVLLAPNDEAALKDIEDELEDGLPFLDIYLADRDEFDAFTSRVFAFDRDQQGKGMIEVSP